jgi:hypothetical protein
MRERVEEGRKEKLRVESRRRRGKLLFSAGLLSANHKSSFTRGPAMIYRFLSYLSSFLLLLLSYSPTFPQLEF